MNKNIELVFYNHFEHRESFELPKGSRPWHIALLLTEGDFEIEANGKNIKIERIKKDLTQEKLAERMNVSQNYIANIERGKENMSLAKILELSVFLGVDIEKLLNFSEEG